MSARDEAEKRLSGMASGTDWAKTDAIKGVGWALLVLADAIAGVVGQAVADRGETFLALREIRDELTETRIEARGR